MKQKITSKLPVQSLLYLLICGGGILAFILLKIIPYQKALVNLDKKIKNINAHIEEQKTLSPFFKDLLEKEQHKGPRLLPCPKRAVLERNNTGIVTPVFRGIAQKSNLQIESIIPDINSIIEDSGILMINLSLKGKFFDFRNFLIELHKIPYMEYTEQIKIQTVRDSNNLEFKLKICLAKE